MVDKENSNSPQKERGERGQALVEYALILTLVALALAAAVAATGPAIGNIFSNVVCNLVEQKTSCQSQADVSLNGNSVSFWQTVTAVASNPPQDRAFPTNPPQVPTSSPTPGPSPTATPITPTPTPSFTPTASITPTETDIPHDAPFYDPIDQPVWWRVNNNIYLGGHDWVGAYYSNTSFSGQPDATLENKDLSPPDTYSWNIAFDWGNGGPSGVTQLQNWSTDNFSVRWTRDIYIAGTASQNVTFTIRSEGSVNVFVDGVSKWSDASTGRNFDSTPLGGQISLSPGAHTLRVDYVTVNGPSGIYVDISQYKGNVAADHAMPSGAANCQWTRIAGPEPNSVSWAWKESPNPTSAGFPSNMNCNLELRGYIDISTLSTPTMSFWDVWDLGGGTTVQVQFADYAPYSYSDPNNTPTDPTDDVITPGSGPNWSAYPPVTLHTGGKDYAWSRSSIPIPSIPSNHITYRFILTSNASAGNRRWYLDDIRVDNADPGKTFTVCTAKPGCPTYWNLDDPSQKNDFIATGRWDLTTDNVAFGPAGMSWAVSGKNSANNAGSDTYVDFGPEQNAQTGSAATGNVNRIHALEFKGVMSFPFNADGTGGALDWNGNDGYPQLTFYQSYSLDVGESLAIQYTRDPIDNVADNWQNVQVLVNALPAPQIVPMQQQVVPLNTIPNWNVQPFRLRFALLVNGSNIPATGGGWWIDDIILERQGVPRYSNYPFCDTADGVFDPSAPGGFRNRGSEQWLISGQWGLANNSKAGGVHSFTDSPSGNYISGQQTSLTLHYPLDMANDTPENLATWGGNKGETFDGVNCSIGVGKTPNRPILSFWQWRALAANESVSIDISRPGHLATGTPAIPPTAVWTYSYNSRTSNQLAWEHVEIDLDAAVKIVTGQSLAQLAATPDKYDDDILIAVRLDTRSDPSVSDGVYIDDLTINDYSEVSHKLWNTSTTVTPLAGAPAAGVGNGPRYVDDIDSPSDWWNRWQTGGTWDAGSPTTEDWGAHSGIYAFTDSPDDSVTSLADTFSALEMNKIIDLRGAKVTDNPTFYFWDHYSLARKGVIKLQVAVQDQYEMTGAGGTPRTRMGYDYIYNWGSNTSYTASSSWDTVWTRPELSRVDTWVREQINLNAYADDPSTTTVNEGKRLKFRFVIDNLDGTSANVRDGWFIDDILVQFRNPRIYTIPFFDQAQNTGNWVTEGIWGLAPDYFRGSGGGPAQFGPNKYNGYYFDCIQWMANPSRTSPQAGDLSQVACTTGNVNTFFNAIPRTDAGTQGWITTRNTGAAASPNNYPTLTESVDPIDNDFGTTGRPFGAPAGTPGATWDDHYMGRWMRNITVAAGDYTFITTSDDAVRLAYTATPGTLSAGWNIINDWSSHSRKVDMQTVTLGAGGYQLVLEWFEGTGNAVIILQAGNNNFSFSDSPKATSVSAAVPSVPFGNSSLMLDGLISLAAPPAGVFKPRLEYYTYYDLGTSATANVEVSIDGGFSWSQSGLSSNCPTGVPSAQCKPTIPDTSGLKQWLPTNDWQYRSNDLSSATYVNRNIGLRFRLNTQSNVGDGWWITDIQVNS